jgi:hypothetical protein
MSDSYASRVFRRFWRNSTERCVGREPSDRHYHVDHSRIAQGHMRPCNGEERIEAPPIHQGTSRCIIHVVVFSLTNMPYRRVRLGETNRFSKERANERKSKSISDHRTRGKSGIREEIFPVIFRSRSFRRKLL